MLGPQAPDGWDQQPLAPHALADTKKPAEHPPKYTFASYLWGLLLFPGPLWTGKASVLCCMGIQAVEGERPLLTALEEENKSPIP